MTQPDTAPSRTWAAPRLAGFAVSLAIALILPFLSSNLDGKTLGDTDDALRRILIRNLLGGQGWFDMTVGSIAPPHGLEMHWSRLIDGGVAGLELVFALFVDQPLAEVLARAIWPLLWIFPAVASAVFIARQLAGEAAGTLALVICICSFALFVQFLPGRIDHHGPQIALMMAGLAALCAIGTHRAAPFLAGGAMALQLAFGLEAVLLPLTGAAWLGVRFAIDPRFGGDLRRFAATLGLGIVVLHAAQTGPARWFQPACDMLGANFAFAIAAGCVVIIFGTHLYRETTLGRMAWLAGACVAAAAVFVAVEPACWRGPFALVDPAIKPIWLDRVQEMQSILHMMNENFSNALSVIVLPILALAALCWILVERYRDPVWLLVAAYLGIASLMGALAIRLTSYAMWCAVPVMAAAIFIVASRWSGRKPRLVWMALAAIFLSPNVIMGATETLASSLGMNTSGPVAEASPCDSQDAFRALDKAPPGLVLSEIDRGPFIAEFTHHSAFAAPYHRIDAAILAALTMLTDDPAVARPKIDANAIDYILICPVKSVAESDEPDKLSSTSLLRQLQRGHVPLWLSPIPLDSPFQMYRVAR